MGWDADLGAEIELGQPAHPDQFVDSRFAELQTLGDVLHRQQFIRTRGATDPIKEETLEHGIPRLPTLDKRQAFKHGPLIQHVELLDDP
jgi:hypothetical protein